MAVTGFSSPPMPELAAEEDVLSLAACHFRSGGGGTVYPQSETGSLPSSQSAASGFGDSSMQDIMQATSSVKLATPEGVLATLAHLMFALSAYRQEISSTTTDICISDSVLQTFHH